jgi:3-hydroxybutyryl-CoA dehydratase
VIEQAPTQIFADDLQLGQTFSGKERSIGDDHFADFARVTGDDHPIHYDDSYALKTRYGKRLAHGLLVMSMTALGATSMSRRIEDSMVAFVEQGARFLKPVFVGDTLKSHFEVVAVERKPGRDKALVRFNVRLVNGRGEIVLEGFHVYLLSLRPDSAAAGTGPSDAT